MEIKQVIWATTFIWFSTILDYKQAINVWKHSFDFDLETAVQISAQCPIRGQPMSRHRAIPPALTPGGTLLPLLWVCSPGDNTAAGPFLIESFQQEVSVGFGFGPGFGSTLG